MIASMQHSVLQVAAGTSIGVQFGSLLGAVAVVMHERQPAAQGLSKALLDTAALIC
jgi:hypothetical protein